MRMVEPEKKISNRKAIAIIFGFLFTFFILVFIGIIVFIVNDNDSQEEAHSINDKYKLIDTIIEPTNDTLIQRPVIELIMSDIKAEEPEYAIDKSSGNIYKKVFTGRRVNIAITGVDSRAGERYKHADANHIISILPDLGKIEIISVPRDTPADAGFDDTTGQNKLTVVRAAKGRNYYLSELAYIANLDKIHFFAEFGFSQAMGIFSWLGFNDPASTLKVLRSRKHLGGDDFQRAYNQGQFMRQMLLSHHKRFDGDLGDLMLRVGLSLVETNLKTDSLKSILKTLKSNGFGDKDDINVRVMPPMGMNFKIYDFTDEKSILSLAKLIDAKNKTGKDSLNNNLMNQLEDKLLELITETQLIAETKPIQGISKIRIYFDQRIWYQFQDSIKSANIRDKITNLLITMYNKAGNSKEANNIYNLYQKELILNKMKLSNLDSNQITNENNSISTTRQSR